MAPLRCGSPDQLKSAITRPCRYEPGVNRTYEDLAAHYGAVVIPARPRKPRDKAAVENCVLIAQRWILARLRDQTFFELGPLNAAIRVLLDELNDRPMKKLSVSRRVLYEQLDRPALRPLPAARYVLAQWKRCSVNIDYHVAVEHHVYSVPYQLVREQVEVRYTTNTVEIFHRDKRIASHRRRYDRQPSTVAEHMPSAHRAHAEWSPSRLIGWANKVGTATGKLVAQILQSRPHPEQGYRPCLGIMQLGRRHGNVRLEAACARALALGSCRYLRHNRDRGGPMLIDPASLEAVDFTHPRRLNRQQILTLGACAWIAERHNLVVTGPCGVGKSFLACAFVERACRRGFTARYLRMPRLLHELAVGRGDGSYTRLLTRLAKLDLLAIDDWMLAPLRDTERRDLTEVIEDRAERASTLIASQLPVTDWHAVIGDPNQADAICDRLLHDAHRIDLKGRSMRRTHDAPANGQKETT